MNISTILQLKSHCIGNNFLDELKWLINDFLEDYLFCNYFVTTFVIYFNTMELALIAIGNSKGIRLPKALIKKYHLEKTIELVLEKDHIKLRPIRKVREGWDNQFKRMQEAKDDRLLLPDFFEDENLDEWK